jgi:hypothetical protein
MSGTPAQIPWLPVTLGLIAAVAFWLTTKPTHAHFDYTYRIGLAFLNGHLGTQPEPPSWLNEMVPKDGRFYSVFPLGAVLSVLPVSVLGASGVISKFPGHEVAAAIIGLSVYFFFQLSSMERQTRGRRILLAFFPAFGTWIWCNLGFAGAWQIALGFALIGEVGALYFMFVRPQPVTAGAFFALAFGNRTELLLVMPVFLWLWLAQPTATKSKDWFDRIKQGKWVLAKFLLIPTALALLTAAYNYARFQSVTDFGYGHIPNVLQEPWYEHGLFSVHAIPWNVHKMLFEGFADDPEFPYVRFYPFGCSIFLASPFLCLIFREGGSLRRLTWTVIALLTFALWCHGNPGGWEFSYRYAILLIPWMFLLIVGNGPKKISATELGLFFISVAINAIATYEFLWTDRIHP